MVTLNLVLGYNTSKSQLDDSTAAKPSNNSNSNNNLNRNHNHNINSKTVRNNITNMTTRTAMLNHNAKKAQFLPHFPKWAQNNTVTTISTNNDNKGLKIL